MQRLHGDDADLPSTIDQRNRDGTLGMIQPPDAGRKSVQLCEVMLAMADTTSSGVGHTWGFPASKTHPERGSATSAPTASRAVN